MTTTKRRPKVAPKTKTPFAPPNIAEAQAMFERILVEELRESWNEDQVRGRIKLLLANRLETLVMEYLGFDKTWGKWEINRCSEQQANAVGATVRELAAKALEQGVAKAMDQGKLTFNDKMIEAMDKEFQNYLTGYEMRKAMQILAQAKLDNLIKVLNGKLEGAVA